MNWTEKEIQLLRELFPDHSTKKIAAMLGRTYSSIVGEAGKLGIKKSIAFFKSEKSGRNNVLQSINTRFRKGNVPMNKGQKMPESVYEKAQATMFKKGHLPHNTKFDQAITLRKSKGKTGKYYQYIRLKNGVWKELHRHIWEKENGEIPEGYNIIFKDNNPINVELSNLELVSNADLMRRNTIHRYPTEIKSAIHANAKLKRTIKRYEKQN